MKTALGKDVFGIGYRVWQWFVKINEAEYV